MGEVRRTGTKLVATLGADPLSRDVSVAFAAEQAERPGLTWIRWLGWILLPLGLAGVFLGRDERREVLLVGVLSAPVAAWLTYAQPELRGLTVSCFLIGLGPAWAALRGGSPRRRAGVLAAGLAGMVLLGWAAPRILPGQGELGDDYYYVGVGHDQAGRGSAAFRAYERALNRQPDNPYPRLALAGMFVRDNLPAEALRELEALYRESPEFYPGLGPLVRLYLAEGRYEDAAQVYAKLVALEPWNPEWHNGLGTVYVQLGFFTEAVEAFESALAVAPGYQPARDNLAALSTQGYGITTDGDPLQREAEQIRGLIQGQRFGEADTRLSAAYTEHGRAVPLVFLEGTMRLFEQKPDEAIVLFEEIQDTMGERVEFLQNLGVAYLQDGQMDRGIAVLERALEIQPDNLMVRRTLEQARSIPGGDGNRP